MASAALALLAAIVVVDFASAPGASLWWVGRLAETTAILASAVGALLLAGAPLDELLAPLAERDPFRILEIGLAPEVRALIAAVRRKDRGTRDHLVRVTQLALRVGERLPLPARRLRLLGLGALLHDIGKLVVPDAVLGKAGPLNAHEQDVMRAHTARGAELLARSPLLAPVAPIVRSHHERVDGGGYPDGLSGASIALEARIIGVADAWDAMTQDRVYRQGLDPGEARRRLLAGAGSHWDATVVRALLTLSPVEGASDLVDAGVSEEVADRLRVAMDAVA